MLPFLAQGGALAIEDAAVLARELARTPHDPVAALAAYQADRKPRARQVQAAARQNGGAYHMGFPLTLGRDLVLRGLSGQRMLKRYDWLYGWGRGGA